MPCRILVVEDEPENRLFIGLMLRTEGYDVVEAEDGPAAFGLLEGGAQPDLILLDVMMPGMNGWDLLQRLRADERHRRLPVVLCTAMDMPYDRQRARDLGATALLAKPHDAQCLIDIVAAVSAVAGSAAVRG